MENQNSASKQKKNTKKSQSSTNSGHFWSIFWCGFYLIILALVVVYVLIRILPITNGTSVQIKLFWFPPFSITDELRLIIIAALAGALGSLIHSMTSFATYVGNKQFVTSWIWWFVLRPFIGMSLALIFYFVVRGGFFAMTAETKALSPFGVAGLSGLVGMFSKQAIDKLREVFETLFKTTESDKRKNKLEAR
jgi:magnesium-transporting ATPase (P-type)